jgi:DNA-binding NarL/FixJ family response regulator
MVVKVLIVDDHQLMIEGYKSMLSLNDKEINFEFTEAHTCEKAYQIITNPQNATLFDIVFLDYTINPTFPEKNIQNGEDLGKLVRKHLPSSKIVMLTAHFDALKLNSVFNTIQPNGLLIKSDLKPIELFEAVKKVLNNESYFTEAALKGIKEKLLTHGFLDTIDKQIITLIAEGLQISSIANRLNKSEDTIKKRKSKIKDLLGIHKGGDEDILRECRALGLL